MSKIYLLSEDSGMKKSSEIVGEMNQTEERILRYEERIEKLRNRLVHLQKLKDKVTHREELAVGVDVIIAEVEDSSSSGIGGRYAVTTTEGYTWWWPNNRPPKVGEKVRITQKWYETIKRHYEGKE